MGIKSRWDLALLHIIWYVLVIECIWIWIIMNMCYREENALYCPFIVNIFHIHDVSCGDNQQVHRLVEQKLQEPMMRQSGWNSKELRKLKSLTLWEKKTDLAEDRYDVRGHNMCLIKWGDTREERFDDAVYFF